MDDGELWDAFHAQTLTHAQWNHESHLRMACMHAQRFDLDEAHLRLRAGIIRLNQRHGLVETGARGYFETLTRVWLVLVADALRRVGVADSRALIAACPELLDRDLPLRHYSKALLTTVRARALFVEPDLAPLPEVP
jgi:N-formylglutamate deformylase